MPNTDLSNILEDLALFKARYKPIPLVDKPAGCSIPAFDAREVNTDIGSVPVIDKECLSEFIPIPIVPTPYIPITDIETPCPDGFNFGSITNGFGVVYSSGALLQAEVGTGLSDNTTPDFELQIPDGYTMPEIGINIATTVTSIAVTSGGSGYVSAPIVTIGAPNVAGIQATAVAVLTGGVVTNVRITNPGHGYTSAPSVTFDSGAAAATAAAGVTHTKRRVKQVNSATQLELVTTFPITIGSLGNGVGYKIHRMVVTVDPGKPVGGSISFYEFGEGEVDAGCGGYFIGDINIDADNINVNIPCPSGITFTPTGTITFTGVVGGTETVDFEINDSDRCNPIFGFENVTIAIPDIPTLTCAPNGVVDLSVNASAITITKNVIDASPVNQTISLSAASSTACNKVLDLTNLNGAIVIPPCPNGFTTTGADADLTYKEFNYATNAMVEKTIKFDMVRTACSFDVRRVDANQIIVPRIALTNDISNFFNFTVTYDIDGNGYTTVIINPNLKYDGGGTAITNSNLYNAIKTALLADNALAGCNGCAVWS